MTGHRAPAAAATVGGRVATLGAAQPDRVALVVDGAGGLTYAEWDARSNGVARGLVARGVRPGDPVALRFDARHWAEFAVAHLGVLRAGGVAVLLSPGAPPAAQRRAVGHAGAVGLLWAGGAGPPAGLSAWVAGEGEVAAGHDTGPVAAPAETDALAELTYAADPLAPPAPGARRHSELAGPPCPSIGGWFVHAWAPGSVGGRHGLRLLRDGAAAGVLALGAFDAGRLCALLGERRAVGCGLTPGLAAALVASGHAGGHDLSAVTEVVLSGRPSAELAAGLRAAFPRAAVRVLDDLADDGRPPGLAADRSAPVAVSQEAMVWHEQFTPGSFNLPCLVRRHEGALDVGALEWALSEMGRRHQPLRSTFAVVDGEARQVVHDDRTVTLVVADIAGLAPGAGDAEVARLLADASSRPFDLAAGPLFEPLLVRLGPDDCLLVVRLHHVVFDDWSVDVFRRELSALYAAARAGRPSPLVEPVTTFADASRRQRRRLAGEDGDAQRSWWRDELCDAPLSVQLDLGGDEAQPGAALRMQVEPALADTLRALARQLRATPYMTVLAAFSVLLSGITGQDDLVIAAVVAHRNTSDVEPLIGCFTKKVPVRLRVDGDPTFADVVARTRASLLGALAHQDVGFDAALGEGLGGAAAAHGVVPQVNVVFQAETPQQVRLALPGLTTSPYEVRPGSRAERHFSAGPEEGDDQGPRWGDGIYLGTFLILSLLEDAGGMALLARGVFSGPAAERLLADFLLLLASVAGDPFQPVSTLRARLPAPAPAGDVVELRGFRADRARLEAALGRCPGVAEVVVVAMRTVAGAGPRLVAYVVPDGPAPTLGALRRALWAERPGTLWPAEAVMVDALPRRPDGRPDVDALPAPGGAGAGLPDEPDPVAALLAAMWEEIGGRPATPDRNYWQDFSFLQLLAEAREAGLVIADRHVVRSRTPATLAAALAATAAPSP